MQTVELYQTVHKDPCLYASLRHKRTHVELMSAEYGLSPEEFGNVQQRARAAFNAAFHYTSRANLQIFLSYRIYLIIHQVVGSSGQNTWLMRVLNVGMVDLNHFWGSDHSEGSRWIIVLSLKSSFCHFAIRACPHIFGLLRIANTWGLLLEISNRIFRISEFSPFDTNNFTARYPWTWH